VAYTDGACRGNKAVALSSPPAGWGLVLCGVSSGADGREQCTPVASRYGAVVTKADHADFLGADCPSNNTGELSAIGHALLLASSPDSPLQSGADLILRYDSEYAAKSVQGIFNGAMNAALILRCRELLAAARRGRTVSFEKVKGHSGNAMNDEADRLANLGALEATKLPAELVSSTRTALVVPTKKRPRKKERE
jgi:ribonuclease HI